MSDPLYDLLSAHLPKTRIQDANNKSTTDLSSKYLSRLLSLRLTDLTTTEPQSLTQANHSNNVSLQALSSRSHKTTTASASHLSTLHTSLPSLIGSITEVRESVPSLDESAVTFASTYARSRDVDNAILQARKDSMLLARQSDKLTDMLDLPALLSTAIASAGSGAAGGANYSQALDLFAHIRRLSIIYPDSALVKSVQAEAEVAMKSMTTNLLQSLRSPTVRLAAAIRTVGWLRRVVPELSTVQPFLPLVENPSTGLSTNVTQPPQAETSQSEGSFGALFLVSRLHTFLTMTEALAPLRDLADQEIERRITASNNTGNSSSNAQSQGQGGRRSSVSSSSLHGTQTERFLKRYIEIFREQSFSTISMYRNIFPLSESEMEDGDGSDLDLLALPSALQQFPLHLVEIFMEVLRTYLPNITDSAARESLLMQVLYAANSLGRLGADFSMMISLLSEEITIESQSKEAQGTEDNQRTLAQDEKSQSEPEWARIMKKHRVQAARLDVLAAGRKDTAQRSTDIAVI